MDGPELDALAAAFRSCTLPRAEWTHVAHLRVGAWHVYHHGAEAGARHTAHRHLPAERASRPNSPTGGYHETITVAYVCLIDAFLATFASHVPLDRRVQSMLEGTLAERSFVATFWSRELLMSPEARAAWVPPDVAPLALPE